MNSFLSELIRGFDFSNDIERDFYKLFIRHELNELAHHSYMVGTKARELAKKFGVDENAAQIAGYLHDLGNIVKAEERLRFANELNIKVLPEEEVSTILLHQRFSRIIAKEIFDVKNEEVLSAIECHTTLKANASQLDYILFISDKLQWESSYDSIFKKEMLRGLEISLEHSAFEYIKYHFDNCDKFKVVHPWQLMAFNYLRDRCVA